MKLLLLGGGSKNIRIRIVEVLSNEWPLTSKAIYNRITRLTNARVTYQGVYKQLIELADEGVLDKQNKLYSLNEEWMRVLKEFSTQFLDQKVGGQEDNSKHLDEGDVKYLASRYLHVYLSLIKKSARRIEKYQLLRAREFELNNLDNREIGKYVDVLETVKREKHLLILGESGAGKTTLLKKMALNLATEQGRYPLFFSLTNFYEDRIENIVAHEIERISKQEISDKFVLELIKNGNFAFLLDGLNEVTGVVGKGEGERDKRLTAIKAINYWMSAYPKNIFIISTRIQDDPKDKLDIKTIRIQPLKLKEIHQFLKSNHANALFEKIANHKHLLSLCGNPLMLQLILRRYLRTNLVVENKVELYLGIVEDFLYNWESKNLQKNTDELEELLTMLEYLAFAMTTTGTVIEKGNAIAFMRKLDNHLQEGVVERFLNDAANIGIIQIIDNQIQFMHPSFQEYFAARLLHRRILEGKADYQEIGNEFNLAQWHDVIIQLSGIIEDSTELIKTIKSKDRLLAGECLENANHVDRKIIEDIIEELVSLQEMKSIEKRWASLTILEKIGEEAISTLLGRLNFEKDETVKRRLYWVIGHFRDKRTEDLLLSRINEKETHTLVHVLEGLTELNKLSKPNHLEPLLNNSNPLIRAKVLVIAYQNYEKISKPFKNKCRKTEPKTIKNAIELLDSPDYWVRSHTALALGQLKAKNAVEKLVEQISSDTNPSARWYASVALSSMGEKRSMNLLENNMKHTKFKMEVVRAIELLNRRATHSRELVEALKYTG